MKTINAVTGLILLSMVSCHPLGELSETDLGFCAFARNADGTCHGSSEESANNALSVTAVNIVSGQIVVTGGNLSKVESIRITGASGFDKTLEIKSVIDSELIVEALEGVSLITGAIFNIVISNAYGAVTFPIIISVADNSIAPTKLSTASVNPGDVLQYNGTNWITAPLTGLTYIASWDASINAPTLSSAGATTNPSAGDYYVVSITGATSIDGETGWVSGDWIIFNGSSWDKISNSGAVLSFNSRSGAILPTAGDYDFSMIGSGAGVYLDYKPSGVACGEGQVMKYHDDANDALDGWVCASDELGATASSASNDSDVVINADAISDNTGEIQFQIGGTTHATIDNSGDLNIANNLNVGSSSLGVTGAALSINGGTAAPTVFAIGEDNQNYAATKWDETNNIMSFGTKVNNVDYADTLVLKNGNVGIGMTPSVAKLEVDGNIRNKNGYISGQWTSGEGYQTGIGIINSNSMYYAMHLSGGWSRLTSKYGSGLKINEANSNPIVFEQSGSEKMRIDSNGRVGIGISSPNSKLDVQGGGITVGANVEYTSSVNLGNAGSFRIGNSEVLRKDGSNLSFAQGAVVAEFNGNVGVGTNSPSEKLEVAGNIRLDNYNFELGTGIGSTIYGVDDDKIYIESDFWISLITGNKISLNSPRVELTDELLLTSGTILDLTVDDNRTTVAYGEDYSTPFVISGRAKNVSQFIFNRKVSGATGSLFDIKEYDQSRFTVSSSGDIGIGTESPTVKLDIRGDTKIYSDGTSNWVYINGGDSSNNNAQISSRFNQMQLITNAGAGVPHITLLPGTGGSVGIGTTSPGEKLEVNGNGLATAWNTSSDIRFKKNVSKIENPLEMLLSLNGVYYDWRVSDFPKRNFTSRTQIGLIAQEVEKVLPEVVYTAKDGYKSISYDKFTPLIIEATKVQQKRIEALEFENRAMREVLCELKPEASFCN